MSIPFSNKEVADVWWKLKQSDIKHKTVALMQISEYGTHKNRAEHKIMEVMCTVYAKKWDSVSTHAKKNMTRMIMEHTRRVCKEKHVHCLRRPFDFPEY